MQWPPTSPGVKGRKFHFVLAAARTKWNFLPFTPGLVGGHCIGVDPYYLTHRAEKAGFDPKIILAGRRVNDAVGKKVARECLRLIKDGGRRPERVTVPVSYTH